MTHELETDPEVFDAVAKGEKTFEIRQDDRGFNVGDELLLRRTKHTGYEMRRLKYPLIFTGEQEQRKVTHILRGPIYGLADGWVILSLNAEVSEPGDRRAENATGAQPPGSLH